MSLSPYPGLVSTPTPQIWPVAVIVVVVVLRAPADILPAALSAVASIVALLLGKEALRQQAPVVARS
ncbi:hypothetical protein [Kitasatospora xanthocidica]|uniref:hypothetical protein n=1 Tax=Kitasatospora xanthocidica TaxID=83382 RepID=UPI0011C39A71|nr:hypothetical protein [Kitasatospora xanthocidica]